MKFAVKCTYILPCMLFVVLRYMNGVIFMLHTVFFYPRNTQTHTDSFPQSEVFKRILVKDFIWELVAYGKKSWRKSLKKSMAYGQKSIFLVLILSP